MGSTDFSVAEKLLIAARRLEDEGRGVFSAEDLVVAAWQEFPDAFGLRGYRLEDGRARYPDSNRVFAEIMGSKPLRRLGLLAKTGAKMYQLTESGRQRARLLGARQGTRENIVRAGLLRPDEQEFKRLLQARALGKYKDGKSDEITFYDACSFWGISPRSSAKNLNARVAHFKALVEEAGKALKGEVVSFSHGGPGYSAHDLADLLAVHENMLSRFSDDLSVIRERTDERL